MQKQLLSDFSKVTKSDWRAKIEADLKGKPFDNLLWTKEGIEGGPIYTQEDLNGIEGLDQLQNNAYIRNADIFGARHWTNYQLIKVTDESKANKEALDALNLGADGLVFSIAAPPDFEKLLDSIQLEYCAVAFEAEAPVPNLVQHYINYIAQTETDLAKVTGFIQAEGSPSIEGIKNSSAAEGLKTINIRLPEAHAKANAVQELALLLTQVSRTITALRDAGLSSDVLSQTTQFQLSIGPHYFVEMAKVRALRLLAQALWAGFGQEVDADEIAILSASGDWSAPVEDKHNHLLAATTGAMSAIIGGCNGLLLRAFNNTFDTHESLASRNARNISSILKEEAYLGKVVDPAAGSYYIESITNQLIERAWSLFLRLEDVEDFDDIDINSLNTKLSEHEA